MKMKFGALLFSIFAIIVVAAIALRTFAPPVLWSYQEPGSLSAAPAFVLFNPLRDRAPEMKADEFLSLIKAGKCREAVANARLERFDTEKFCERESVYKLTGWQLRFRADRERLVELTVLPIRGEQLGVEMWIELREESGDWKVTAVNAFY